MGYLTEGEPSRPTEKAFALLDEPAITSAFISYKRQDTSTLVLLLQSRLQHHGVRAYMDKDMSGGEIWKSALEREARACNKFLLLLSENALKPDSSGKSWVIQEIRWAKEDDPGKIVPIKLPSFDKWKEKTAPDIAEVIRENQRHPINPDDARECDTSIDSLLRQVFGVTT